MKHTLIIFALLTATIQTFAQSPRIKLNQITKDSLSGSVLISSPTDSGMVYSRDLYISYGVSDTVLILNGDTLAATSAIISSVLSDGVTIVGDGTTGSELTADTSVLATLRALSDSLALVISSVTADGVTITGDGTVGSPLKVDTTTYIATKQDLDAKQDQLNGTGFVKATGTTISYDNSTYLTTEVDGSTTNELQTISTSGAAGNITLSDGGGTLNLNVNDADASTTNEIQDISTTGAAGNISISSGSTLNLNVDDADASATNEGSLTVGAGTASTSVISSNTSGSTDVTLTAGTNVTLSESGNNITIAATGGGTTYNNITETADTLYITDYLDVDTSTLYVDAVNNRVGIGTSTPTQTFEVDLLNDGINNKFFIQKSPIRKGHQFGGISDDTIAYSFSSDTTNVFMFIDMFGYKDDLGDIGGGDYQGFTVAKNDFTFGGDLVEKSGALQIFNYYDDGGYNYYSIGSDYLPNARVGIGVTGASHQLELAIDDAAKPSTTAWSTTSDIRVKKNIVPYNKGLDAILQLNPIEYDYNGLAGFKEGYGGIGIIAQQVKPIIPETISTYKAKLNVTDDEETTLLNFNPHALTFMFINAFKEQQAIINQQSNEIETLKSQIQLILSEIEQIKNN